MPVVTAYLQILILFYQPGGLRLLRLQLVQEVSSRVRGVGEIELARLQLVRELFVLQTQTAFDPIAVQEEILKEPRRELLLYILLGAPWKEEWLGARHGPPGQQRRDGGMWGGACTDPNKRVAGIVLELQLMESLHKINDALSEGGHVLPSFVVGIRSIALACFARDKKME